MKKIIVNTEIPADFDCGARVRCGTYNLVNTTGRGGARNSKEEPAYSLDGLTVSKKQVENYIALGYAEIINDESNTEVEIMSNLAVVKQSESAVMVQTPKEQIEAASDMARLLKDVVNKAGLAKKLGGTKEHLEFEAWQTIARWHHCTPSTEWTRPIMQSDQIAGWEARVNVLDEKGRIIGSSEGMCMYDEKNWKGKPSYALRSMAQTRTAGKALRSLFAHIAVLAGYSPTPAEEMDGVEIRHDTPPTAHKSDSKEPEESKPIPTEAETAEFIPSAIMMKEGETKGKPWVRYTILEGDTKYTTFNKSFAELAKSANIDGKPVKVWFKTGKYGNDIELLVDPLAEASNPGEDDDRYPR
jgi:tellurite resistance-related uncharacterized protein